MSAHGPTVVDYITSKNKHGKTIHFRAGQPVLYEKSSCITGLIPTYVAHVYSQGIIPEYSVSDRVFAPDSVAIHFTPLYIDQVRMMLETGKYYDQSISAGVLAKWALWVHEKDNSVISKQSRRVERLAAWKAKPKSTGHDAPQEGFGSSHSVWGGHGSWDEGGQGSQWESGCAGSSQNGWDSNSGWDKE